MATKFKSYKENYEASKELAHGDLITVTYELDAEDECEITMYLGTITKGMFGESKTPKSRELGKATYPETKEITFEIDRKINEGKYFIYLEDKKKSKVKTECAAFSTTNPPGLIELESPTELEKEYVQGKVFDIGFTIAGARVAGEDTDPDDVEREVGIWLGTKAKPRGKEIATKKWPADKDDTVSWMMDRTVQRGEYFIHIADKEDATCFANSTPFAVPTPAKLTIEVTEQPINDIAQTHTQEMKVKVNDIIEPCELDVYLIWSEKIVGGSPVEKKLTDDGGMYSRLAVPDADTEVEFKWSAPRELLAGDYMFKFEMKGEKQTVMKSKPFTLTSPYETALNNSRDAHPPFAAGSDELRDFSICSILARIVQKNHFNVDVTTLFSKPGFADERPEDYPDIPTLNMLQWTVALANKTKVTVELVANNVDGIKDKPDDLEFHPQWGVYVVHETKTVVLAFRNDSWKGRPKAKFATAGPTEETSELAGALFPQQLYRAIETHFDRILFDLEDVLERLGDEYKLIVTGHSLGGALATVFSFLALADKGNEEPGGILMQHEFKVVTFGAPKVACKPVAPGAAEEAAAKKAKETERERKISEKSKDGKDGDGDGGDDGDDDGEAAGGGAEEDPESKGLDEAWEEGALEDEFGGLDEFAAEHFFNIVNEYDVVPRAFGNQVADHKFSSMQWPKAAAKLKNVAANLELPWFEHAFKAGDLVHEYDSVGVYIALTSEDDVSLTAVPPSGEKEEAAEEAAPADGEEAKKETEKEKKEKEDAKKAAAAEAAAEVAEAAAKNPLWRLSTVVSDWQEAYLRLDMRQPSDLKMLRKFHALSSYSQNLGAALIGHIKPALTVQFGGCGLDDLTSVGPASDAAETRKKEVAWPLEDGQNLTVLWEKEMFRPGEAVTVRVRGKTSATAAWQSKPDESSPKYDAETAEFKSDDMVMQLSTGEHVVELMQGTGPHKVVVTSHPFYATLNKTRIAEIKKAATEAKV